MENYYEARRREGQWYGVVYHWDTTGNKQIELFRGVLRESEEEALDDAVEWSDENDIDMRLG